jgi:hypothetical protein
MRTNTADLIFSTGNWTEEAHPVSGQTVTVPQGHVGAVYFADSAQVSGTGGFHAACEAAIKPTLEQTVTAMVGVVNTWICGSDFKQSDLPMDVLRAKAGHTFPTGSQQGDNKDEIIDMFEDAL